MINITDLNNPSFLLWPINNNRTAWRPFSIPVVLVVPHRRSRSGTSLSYSDILSITIYIEDAPTQALVAGPEHVGLRVPDRALYEQRLTAFDIDECLIDTDAVDFIDADHFTYTTRSRVTEVVQYLANADYIDLSMISIPTEGLTPGVYNLVYKCEFYNRIIAETNSSLMCIDPAELVSTSFTFAIQHPGAVMEEFHRSMPEVYLTTAEKSKDTTLEFIRPFTDILQDIADEQHFLQQLNWISEVRPEIIPYLSSSLGWDLPYFPESLDSLRKAVLRKTVALQNLKGSKRAVVEIFNLFGMNISIEHLWWSEDGKILIRPNSKMLGSYASQSIITTVDSQIDPVLSNWSTTDSEKFGVFNIRLLYEPLSDVTLDAYLVEIGGAAHTELLAIVDEITETATSYGSDSCVISADLTIPTIIHDRLDGKEIIGYSEISSDKASTPIHVGTQYPLIQSGVQFNIENNELDITLNGYLDTSYAVFIFASYTKKTYHVPSTLTDNRSNRFDMTITNKLDGSAVDSATLEFALEFLNRLKSFHSLLHTVLLDNKFTETYQVTDLIVGGDVEQRFDTDLGRLQLLPAFVPQIPADPTICSDLNPSKIGYRPEDIAYRTAIINNLKEEHAAWQAFDGRTDEQIGEVPTLPLIGRDACQYTQYGQDKTTTDDVDDTIDYDGFVKESGGYGEPVCGDTALVDFKFKGRVRDGLAQELALTIREVYQNRFCEYSYGSGIYWLSGAGKQLNYTSSYDGINRIAMQRPSLNIDIPIQHFPGCRFIYGGAMEETFTSTVWRKKPWDFTFTCPNNPPDYLNAILTTDNDGNQFLTYDDEPYVIEGNGIVSDFTAYNDHTSRFDPSKIVHSIYSSQPAGHASVTLTGVTQTAGSSIEPSEPLFTSASECGTHFEDYIDGYPSLIGEQAIDLSGIYSELHLQMGIPTPGNQTTAIFFYGSGILVSTGIRYDCSCSKFGCGTEPPTVCELSQYQDEGGAYDWNHDKAIVSSILTLNESFGAHNQRYDGSIPTFLELLPA